MGLRGVLEFVKIEHTLFSLPFILIGYIHAHNQFWTELSSDRFGIDIVWILVAAVGARGLAMSLNRIIDRDIDAANPRTKSRHLASGAMTMKTAWTLSAVFLGMLLFGAWRLNEVALKMAWLPVLAFVVYPYTKRYTWLCHFWLGLCLGLAPAAAWVAVTADVHGWYAITGGSGAYSQGHGEFLWYPEIFWISLGVALWIASFDINYARMDIKSDIENGIPRSLQIWRKGDDQNVDTTDAPMVRMFCTLESCRGGLVSDISGDNVRSEHWSSVVQ